MSDLRPKCTKFNIRWGSTSHPAGELTGRASLRQTVHNHRASVHQAAKLVAAFLRAAGLAESNGSLPLAL